MTTGALAGDTKLKSEDQPGDSLEAELTRVRAKRLTRAERPQYLGNAEFEEEVCLMSLRFLIGPLDAKHIELSLRMCLCSSKSPAYWWSQTYPYMTCEKP